MGNLNSKQDRNAPGFLLYAGVILRLIGIIFIGSFLGEAFFTILFPVSPTEISGLDDPDRQQNLYIAAQIANQVFVFFVLPGLYLMFFNKELAPQLFRKKNNLVIYFLAGILLILAASPFLELITSWNQQLDLPEVFRQMEEQVKATMRIMVIYENTSELLLVLLVVTVLPAIGEEFLFRGVVQNELLRVSKNPHAAIWTTAILFSIIHLQFFGFFPRLFLGMIFGYLYYWSGNLIIPIIMHFLNNLATLVVMNEFPEMLNESDTIDVSLSSAIVSLVITIILFILIIRFRERQVNE